MNKNLFLVALLATASANATTVIDSFNDVKGATNAITLAQINSTGIGGIGFTTKYEQTGSAVAVLRTNDLTVAVAQYVSGQTGTPQHWSVAATPLSSGLARRTQSRSTPAMYGTIWFSFLASLLTPNGDVALTFNGTFSASGQFANGTPGMRVGLGNYANSSSRGALGVGPLATASAQAELTNIVSGVNGAKTAAGFVPTNGTAGLVLGRIDIDPSSGYPRVSLWYNPDVPDAASLPTPTLMFSDSNYTVVPTTVTRIGYQNVRSGSLGIQNELIDNVKLSDEPNGFDIVYLNAPLPIPTINVTATVPVGSDVGPTNVVFTVTSDRPLASDLSIPYTLSGVATNGYIPFSSPVTYLMPDFIDPNFDPNTQTSTLTMPAGTSNAVVTLTVTNNGVPKAIESVILTLAPSAASSYLLASASASAVIVPANDAKTSVQYMFVNNLLPQIWDTNLIASTVNGSGVGSGFNSAYNNTGYGPWDFPAPNACLVAPSTTTATNDEATALAHGSFISFNLSPVPGRSMTLTNLQFMALYGNYFNQNPAATGAVVFVRSSADSFAADLGSFALVPAESIFPSPGWTTNSIALGPSFASLSSQVEFRLYIYDDAPSTGQVGVRLGNLFVAGRTDTLPPGPQQVYVSSTIPNAAQPATPGQFTVTRAGDTSNPLTVNYTLSGTASNAIDYVLLPGSVTILPGQSNAAIDLVPIDNGIPFMPVRTAVLNLAPDAGYGVLLPSSATVSIADNDVYGGLAVYQFTEANNSAVSLAAVAVGSVPAALTSQVTAVNAAAGAGLGSFGAGGVAGNGHGYGTGESVSPPAEFFVRSSVLTNDEANAILGNQYVSFILGPKAGYALNLSRFSVWVRFDAGAAYIANWALRSSADGFAADLANWTVPGNGSVVTYQYLTTTLASPAFQHLGSGVEFRLYFYETTQNDPSAGSHYLRTDDVYFQGTVEAQAAGAQQVTVTASAPNASTPNTNGLFTLTRVGDASQPLTVYYALTGTASNGVDYVFLGGTTNFAAGVSNIFLPILVLDPAGVPGAPTKTVLLSFLPSTNYNIIVSASNTVTIADGNVYSGLAVYQFNENSNAAPSLASAAVATIPDALTNQLTAANAATGPGLAPFGANDGVNIVGYGTGEYVSPPTELYVKANALAATEADAVLAGQYVSFTLAPNAGYTMNLSRVTAWIKLQAGAAYTATWVLRSSLDGFTTNLLSQTLAGISTTTSPTISYQLLQGLLAGPAFQNLTAAVEFRLYFYTATQNDPNLANDFLRIDDVYFQGTIGAPTATPPAITRIALADTAVTVSFSGNPSDAATSFHLQSAATVNGTYADDNSAAISGNSGAFQATTTVNGATRFYRVRR